MGATNRISHRWNVSGTVSRELRFPYSLNNKFSHAIVLRPRVPPRRRLIVSGLRLTMGGTEEYLYERGLVDG